jgi:ribosomal protein S16
MRYSEFAVEALKPSEYRSLVKGWDKTKYAELFGGKYRIYIPLESAGPDSKQVKVNQQVSQEVEKLGYKIDDYLKGIASKTENGRVRQIKIGKLLSPSTAQVFANDPVRGATRKSTQLVVISRHPYDIAGMSTDRGWRSCMNLREKGNNKHFVPIDIKAGTIIAYLINANDKNINSPQARMLIKPFVNILGNHEIALGIEDKIYGTAPPEFSKTVSAWVDKINSSRKLNGIFKFDPRLYPDSAFSRTPKFIGGDKETWMNSIDATKQLVLLQHDPSLIQYIRNPSETLQLKVVEEDPFAIKYIKNPEETVQLEAVRKNGTVLISIVKAGITPSETVQEAAVASRGDVIQSIFKAGIKPSETVQVVAVTSYGNAIEYIIKAGITPSETVQEAAVTKNGNAIQYIIKAGIKPSEAVQESAVTNRGSAIEFIIKAGIKPSEAVQVAAVTDDEDEEAIEFIIDAGITLSPAVKRAAGIR